MRFIRAWAAADRHGVFAAQRRMLESMQDYPRHQTGRAYARLLETIGYIVAVLGAISGVITIFQVSLAAGVGYLLGAIVSGIGLVVLGEVVIVLFNIEYNTSVMREDVHRAWAAGEPREPGAALGGDRTVSGEPKSSH